MSEEKTCVKCIELLGAIAAVDPITRSGGTLYEYTSCDFCGAEAEIRWSPRTNKEHVRITHERDCLHGRIRRHMRSAHGVTVGAR